MVYPHHNPHVTPVYTSAQVYNSNTKYKIFRYTQCMADKLFTVFLSSNTNCAA